MSNIYLKVTIETFSKLLFWLQKICQQASFWGAPTHADIIEFYFKFERNYDVLMSKSPCILLNKNINVNKNEAESKMENPTHKETKIAMSWSS